MIIALTRGSNFYYTEKFVATSVVITAPTKGSNSTASTAASALAAACDHRPYEGQQRGQVTAGYFARGVIIAPARAAT